MSTGGTIDSGISWRPETLEEKVNRLEGELTALKMAVDKLNDVIKPDNYTNEVESIKNDVSELQRRVARITPRGNGY